MKSSSVILVDKDSEPLFRNLTSVFRARSIDTRRCSNVDTEADIIVNAAREQGGILVVIYTGKETCRARVGDELSSMVIAISSNKSSLFYIPEPAQTLLPLVQA